jgi:hypothetical protein
MKFERENFFRECWLIPVILANLEIQMVRVIVQGQHGHKSVTLCKNRKAAWFKS